MSEQIVAALCASAFCLVAWGAIAGVAAFLAHRRMVSAERELGAQALPEHERSELWYAGASVVWLSALVLALVGLAQKKWARAGRNCLFVFLAHITLATLAATGSVLSDATGHRGSPLPLVLMACSMAAFGVISGAVFLGRFAWSRAARIEREPRKEGATEPGIERWAIYALAAITWPVGFGAAFVYAKPENVRVGAIALTLSLAQLVVITLATCTALATFVAMNV